jgi:hypothetical protein
MAANLSSILMADLDMVRGKQMPYATAGKPALDVQGLCAVHSQSGLVSSTLNSIHFPCHQVAVLLADHTHHTGLVPESPYVKMDASWAALQARAQTAARAAQTLDPEELRVLQRFYDQLCALVEAQRMSDPLSLMVIHKVSGVSAYGEQV